MVYCGLGNLVKHYIGMHRSVYSLPGDVAGQFTAAPPTCPGDTFTFKCTVTGDRNGITIWRVGGSSECTLLHSTVDAPRPCWSGSPFTVTPGTGFGTSATSYSSTLSGTATSALNGTLVECFGPALSRESRNRVGGSTLQTIGQYMSSLLVSISKNNHSCVISHQSSGITGARGIYIEVHLVNVIHVMVQ